jgi:chemotaxis protein CheY-P-specific phosphatase CheC
MSVAEEAPLLEEDYRDALQEISNVAMGQAADLLARLLNVFVELPIPRVTVIERSELKMAIASLEDEEQVSAVCQGFAGDSITGEAMLIFNDSSYSDISKLMNYDGEHSPDVELELLMDVSNILIGACLKGIAEQLDSDFSQGHPNVLGQHTALSTLLNANVSSWKSALAIEIHYKIENLNINCDLLLLFTEESLQRLTTKISYLLD